MRFLADENVGRLILGALRDRGDVATVVDRLAGASDEAVLRLAVTERRMLVTFDRDYGELIFRRGVEPPPAILYLRIDPADPALAARRLYSLLDDGGVDGHLVVIEPDQFRRRPLPLCVVRDDDVRL